MQSIQLTTQVNADGFLQVKMPPELKNLSLDVFLVFQVLTSANTTPELVYPDSHFYGSCAQDPINIDRR